MIVNESSIFFSKKVVESLNLFYAWIQKKRPEAAPSERKAPFI